MIQAPVLKTFYGRNEYRKVTSWTLPHRYKTRTKFCDRPTGCVKLRDLCYKMFNYP
jgi:hypothetical protein